MINDQINTAEMICCFNHIVHIEDFIFYSNVLVSKIYLV